ncbi:protein SON-like isoform X2 [Arapaima gigas]
MGLRALRRMLGLRRTAPLAPSVMATNIEQIFRDFVMNKIREIEDEGQHPGVTSEGQPDSGVPQSSTKVGLGKEVVAAMEGPPDTGEMAESAGHPQLDDTGVSESTATADIAPSKEGSETPRKKNKKHKRHKSKKKKKKRKEEKERESSSESGVESGGETQARVKNQTPSSKDEPGGREEATGAQELAGNVPAGKSFSPLLIGDGKIKKHKRHLTKKKKKKKKREEEKQEKKSPSRSRSESSSASGSESDSEQKPLSKLPPASSPVFPLDKNLESTSSTVSSGKTQERMSPVQLMQEVEPIKYNPISAENLAENLNAKSGGTCLVSLQEDEKMTSAEAVEVVAKPSDVQGNFSAVQDLPDIIPKLESTYKEELTRANAEVPGDCKGNQETEHEEKRKSRSASRSKSKTRSPSPAKLRNMVTQSTPLKKSCSRSRSQKRTSDKQDSRKVRSSSRRRSRSTSKRRSSPRKRKSRSRSGRRGSRSLSVKRSGRKSRSLSARKQRRSDSRSRTRNRKSRSRSRRHTRSRSIVRRRRSRSRSLSRRRRSRSRSKRSRSHRRTQRSRSVKRGRRSRSRSRSRRRRSVSRSRRSMSRSIRRTRRTRSRSIVILRRSRSRSLLRRNRRSRSRSLRRRSRSKSFKRRRSRSRSMRRSRRSRSRSAARRRRSKTPSPRRSRRSKSRSLTRHHRSRSDSRKEGRKKSQSPKRNRQSKSRSPTKNKSKSRSVSREVRSSEKSSPSAPEKSASKSGTPAKQLYDTDLPPTEFQSKGLTPEQPGEDDGDSKEVQPQTLNSEGFATNEETPADHCVGMHSTDSTAVVSVGPWKPVPFLVDSNTKPELDSVAEGISSSTCAEEATVTEPLEECKSPKRNLVERCFTPEMPLTMEDMYSGSPSQAICKKYDPESSDHLLSVPEDKENLTEFRSGSISSQSQKPPESVSLVPDSSLPEEESDLASSEGLKLEPCVTSPAAEQRRTRSRSPADGDSSQIDRNPECSKSRSASKEGQTPAEKMDSENRSPSLSKNEYSSKQGRLSASASPVAKKRSTSRSSRKKKSKSKSPTRRKHSRSSSSSRRRRSQSKSTSRRKKSKSRSPSRKRKSRSRSHSRKRKSKSPTRRRRSRSKSLTKRKKSRSKSTSRSTKKKRSKSRSPGRKKRSKSRSPRRSKRSKSRSPARRKRSKSTEKNKRSKSRSPARKRRSRSRSANRARRSRSRRSRSLSRRRRGGFRSHSFDRRDRWRREPSHSPILILRKKRSTSRTRRSTSKTPPRLTDLDKDQLLEIAKANAAAMCAKAGMPIPESLRPKAIHQLPLPTPVPSPLNLPLPLPMNLPMGMPMGMPNISMNAAMATMTAATMTAALTNMGALASMPGLPALPSITNKPPPTAMPNTANIEEVKRKVTQKANSISIKELTEKCKMIAESKEEMAVAQPHVSDDEEDKPFGGGALRENKGISFSLSNPSAKPATRTEAAFAKEFPVSSGSQHRRKENDGAYGEWVPMDRKTEKKAAASSSTGAVTEEEGKESDNVFPDAPLQPVDITLAVSERAVAQKRLAENPFDVNAICMLSRAQEQVDAWAQSNSIPGLFTGSTGAQVLSSEELSNSGPQAWVKKDQFLKAAPVSGGVGEFLMRKMGWRTGEGLGKYREGAVEPIVIDFKTDRKGERMFKRASMGGLKRMFKWKHPVSALMEICNKKKWAPPEFVMVHHSGPDHRKNFLFKVVVNGTDYQPQTASPNKKHAKAMAATVALQAMGEVSGDSLHTGPVFTAATSTG